MTSFDSVSNKTKPTRMVQEERQQRSIPGFYMPVYTFIPTQTCVPPHKLAVRSNLTAGLQWGGLYVKKQASLWGRKQNPFSKEGERDACPSGKSCTLYKKLTNLVSWVFSSGLPLLSLRIT